VVGPTDTGKAILVVYDIFGFFPQTLQGADILAETVQARVVVADYLQGKAWPLDKFPPANDAEKAELQSLFGTTANPARTLPFVNAVGKELQKDGATKIGVLGYCWGGKLSVLAGAEDWSDAIASVHPAFLTEEDFNKLKVPIALFPSKDEPIDEYTKAINAISSKPFAAKNVYKIYRTVHHGWAAARGDLTDPENKAQYEDVYSRLATFFQNTLA